MKVYSTNFQLFHASVEKQESFLIHFIVFDWLKINCIFLVFLQSYMDSEIRAIMAQYMPLDSQSEVVNHVNDERA